MRVGKLHQMEAWALIVGPALALLFFVLEPGGMLIDSVEWTDSAGKIRALASNSTLAHVTAFMIPLGLLLTIFGVTGLSRAIVGEDAFAALARFGSVSVSLGGFGWVIADGVHHVLAEIDIRSDQAVAAAIPIQQTGEGLTIMSTLSVALGLMALTVAMWNTKPGGFHRIAAQVSFVVSVIVLVALVIGHTGHNENMILLGRICYFPLVVWIATLGVRFLKEGRRT